MYLLLLPPHLRPSIMSRCLIPLTSVLPFLESRYVAEALDLLAPLAVELLPFGLLQELTSESKLAATIGSTNAGLQLRAIKVTESCTVVQTPDLTYLWI